jgi:hypothetical protein
MYLSLIHKYIRTQITAGLLNSASESKATRTSRPSDLIQKNKTKSQKPPHNFESRPIIDSTIKKTFKEANNQGTDTILRVT